MKILHINTERTWRGGEQQTLYLARGLKERNLKCDLVCQPESPLEHRSREVMIRVFPTAMRSEVDLVAIYKLRRLIKKRGYDIIHSHTSHAHTLAFFASWGIQTKRLVTRRVAFSIYRHSFLHLSGIKYRYMADYYVAISERIKRVLIYDGIPEQRIFLAHSGIDLKRFSRPFSDRLVEEFGLKNDEVVLLNVAHLTIEKGHVYLIRAMPKILEEIPNARLFIVGEGKLYSKLLSLTRSLGLEGKIFFTGFRKDLGAFYRLADLFIMSSLEEGLGTSVLDALALEVPVVATKVGGIPEIVLDHQTGRLVEPGDSVALAKEIIYVLQHPKETQRMRKAGKLFARKHFSIQTMIDKNVSIYKNLLGHE